MDISKKAQVNDNHNNSNKKVKSIMRTTIILANIVIIKTIAILLSSYKYHMHY